MATVRFTSRAYDDIDRLFDFLAVEDPDIAAAAAEVIIDGTSILERHPLVGRPVEGRLRELVISHGHTGYVALYRFLRAADRVDILAIRHQREAGFR